MRPRARKNDPITSHLAADEQTSSGKATTNMLRIALCVHRNEGHTSRELAGLSAMERVEVSRRLADAEQAGWLEKGLPRRCEIGRRKMVTWYARPAFRRLVETYPSRPKR